jgi:hypothetical protein
MVYQYIFYARDKLVGEPGVIETGTLWEAMVKMTENVDPTSISAADLVELRLMPEAEGPA